MAHHIAELMTEAERADPDDRASKTSACAEAILELWAHRSDLQWEHRPLREWHAVLRALASLDPESTESRHFRFLRQAAKDEKDQGANKWLELADGVDYSARLLVRYALSHAAQDASDKSKEWVALAEKTDADAEGDIVAIRELLRERTLLEGEGLDDRQRLTIEDRIARLEEFNRLSAAMIEELRQRSKVADA
jgi:hypothetical protein